MTEFAETDRLATVHLKENRARARAPEIQQELDVAIFDLVEENRFRITPRDSQIVPAGPYDLGIGMAERMLVLEVATHRDIHALTREWLTAPTGMIDSRWAERTWLTASVDANRIGFATTARDLARFGLLILADGTWKETALISDARLIDDMLKSSQRLNPAYGLLWWLNGKEKFLRAGRGSGSGSLVPTAPDDMVAAQGALGRKCYVVPSLGLVVTRLGDAPDPGFDREFWRRLSAAAPNAGSDG